MSKTDVDPLGDRFKWRLHAELNRIQPRYSSPRYMSTARRRIGPWRFAPAGLAAGVAGMLALTAYAATGSANPVVWTERIVTTIEPNDAGPTVTPTSEPSPHAAAPAAPTHHAEATPRAEPSEHPEGTPRPEPSESPQPGFGGGEFQSNPSPSPSPWPGDR